MAISVTRWMVDQLLRSVRRRAYMPLNDETFSTADLLEVCNEEQDSYLVPLLHEISEGLLVHAVDVPITVGVASYKLPERAAGETLDTALISLGNGAFVPMSRVSPDKEGRIGNTTSGVFVEEDDALRLIPAPTNTGTIRLLYHFRPSALVEVADCARILSVDKPGGVATVDPGTVPAAWLMDNHLDLVAGRPGFRPLAIDLLVTDITGDNVTLSSPLPDETQEGDYLALAGTTPLPQIPAEAWHLLAQAAAVKLLEGRNAENYATAAEALKALEGRTRSVLTPRTRRNPTFVHNFNAPGWKFRGRPRNLR